MKRIIATILALTLLSALAVIGVSATDFVPSTDAWEVRLVSAEANGEDVTSKIIVTHYKDRDTLSAEKKAALQAAYEELLKGVSNVTGDYKVGALFDISYEGEIPELKIDCECRKPKPGMLLQASKDFNIDLNESWMIGDSDSDILAGENVGCKTARVTDEESLYDIVERIL